MRVRNVAELFDQFSDYWSPKVVDEFNGQALKFAKLRGEFIWHHHDIEDELFLVVRGMLRMRFREDGAEREVQVGPGEFVIVRHGVEHMPVADDETHVILVEPTSTVNTGNVVNERTVAQLDRL
jgi:mannose-6-phosphate isomerase-like protein (cupin superfamily)